MEIFVGAIALQYRTQRNKKNEKSWLEQVKHSAKILKEEFGDDFDEEEWIEYAKANK